MRQFLLNFELFNCLYIWLVVDRLAYVPWVLIRTFPLQVLYWQTWRLSYPASLVADVLSWLFPMWYVHQNLCNFIGSWTWAKLVISVGYKLWYDLGYNYDLKLNLYKPLDLRHCCFMLSDMPLMEVCSIWDGCCLTK